MKWLGKAGRKDEKRTDEGELLRRPLSEMEMKGKAHGFIAIYEQECGRTRLYLRQRGALRDEWGRIFPDAALRWADYGRLWRAYAVALDGVNTRNASRMG